MKTRVAVLALAGVLSSVSRPASAQPSDLDPRIEKLVASVSEQRLGAILRKLESFETRSSMSSTNSTTRGVGAARQWIFDELKSYSPKLQVAFDSYVVAQQGRFTRDVEIRNVMANLDVAREPALLCHDVAVERHLQFRAVTLELVEDPLPRCANAARR